MIISLSAEQLNRLQAKLADTKYASHEILNTLQAIYDANFEQDIDAAIGHLDEVGQ